MEKPKEKKQIYRKMRGRPKSILENPLRHPCPYLNDRELHYLFDIFREEIKTTCVSPSEYAKKYNIKIGLESVLRAINKKNCIYVVLSKRIKPSYILSILSKTVISLDPTMLEYVNSKVEKLTLDVFGTPSMAFAICKPDNAAVAKNSQELENWIATNKYVRIMPVSPRKRKHEEPIHLGNLALAAQKEETQVSTELMKTSTPEKSTEMIKTATPEKATELTVAPVTTGAAVKETANTDNSNSDFISINDKEEESNNLGSRSAVFDKDMITALKKLSQNAEYKPLTVKKIKPNPDKKSEK